MCREEKSSQKTNIKEEMYFSELYDASKYIIDHLDEFKGFKIHDHLSNEYNSSLKSERAKDLHNRLLAHYSLLIGKRTSDSSKKSVKGSDLMPALDAKSLKSEDLAWILVVFHHYSNKDEIINLKGSLIKIDIEKSTDLSDYLIFCINQKSKGDFKNVQQGALYALNEKYELARRNIIYKMRFEFVDAFDCYRSRICYLEDNLKNLKILPKGYEEFGKLAPVYQAWLYIDLCCYAIMQYVIRGIMRNQENQYKLRSIKIINNIILELIERAEKKKSDIVLEGSPEEMMFQFYSYYYIKDRFLQDISMLKHIENSNKERKNPLPEYSLITYVPKNEMIDWKELQELFSEGEKKEDIKTFKKNMKNCYKGILQFDRASNRKILPEPVSVRAFYRELYRDKTSYNRRQSKTIFNDFLKHQNIGHADYYFIDEKINIGIFREYGLIEEFYAKNELQENLYCLACYSLAQLNPSDMIETFNTAIRSISLTIERIGCNNDKGENSAEVSRIGPRELNEAEELDVLRKKLSLECFHQMGLESVDDICDEDIERTMLFFFKLYNMQFPDGKI